MKVAGFSFIRNALKYDYPIVEAITSILPICDEFVVAVGQSDDATLKLIKEIQSPKIKIIETTWDDSLREGGRVLAVETNKAFAAISKEVDWAFYIQGDEAVHEQYLPIIKQSMQEHLENREVEGLLLNYLHFYGNYHYVGDSRNWYRKEIRVIRNDKDIVSYKDAQGFRKKDNKKLKVKQIDAYVYHYGWVRNPTVLQQKVDNFQAYWHDDESLKKVIVEATDFDYYTIDSLAVFRGTHPKVMSERIKRMNWDFKFDTSKKQLYWRYQFLHFVEKWTGWRMGEYKNYKII